LVFPNAMSAAPLVSLIVVCRNPGPALRAALATAWAQTAAAEVIVIDGASTDGTAAWLETQRARLGSLVSEPDAGVYDAMNRGLARAHGDWVLFLGADDRLAADGVLADAAGWLARTDAGVAAGEVAYTDGRIYRMRARVNPLARNFVHHQGAFYRRALFAEHGGFDPTLAVMADYELNLRLWRRRVAFRPVPLRIAICGTGGLSDRGSWRGYREEIAVRHRHYSPLRCAGWDALAVARFLRKQAVRRRPGLSHG
jgi:putative colanic acid biosynthesis glycosyltransferase